MNMIHRFTSSLQLFHQSYLSPSAALADTAPPDLAASLSKHQLQEQGCKILLQRGLPL